MRGIIFAAGIAKRLGDLTKDLPKCCLAINSFETILTRNLKLMQKLGFNSVTIVTGHAQEKIQTEIEKFKNQFKEIQLIYNPLYKERNNIYSAELIKDLINPDTIVFNSDIVFDEGILAKATHQCKSNPQESFMVIDNHKTLVEEDMKVLLDEQGKIIRIHKSLDCDKSFGEYIGIFHLNDHDREKFAKSLEYMISKEEFDKYYEDALDRITNDLDLKVLSTDGLEWTEIDFLEDYQKAKNLQCVKLEYQNN